MDRESRMQKELLKCAIEAKTDSTTTTQTSSKEDREWLNKAYQNIIKDSNALIEGLKNCLAILRDETIEDDVKEEALESLSEYCEDIDLAKDMEKLGGYPIVIKHLIHRNPVIRAGAADVLAVSTQNNEYCQNALLELKILPKLLKLTEVLGNIEEHQVSIKAIYAISCLVRENEKCLETLLALNGFSYLVKALFSDVNKLQFKSLYLLCSLCKENEKCSRAVFNFEVLPKLVKLLNESDNTDVVVYSLDLLHFLAKYNFKQFKMDCQSNSINLNEIISDLLKKKSLQDEIVDIKERCGILKQVLKKK